MFAVLMAAAVLAQPPVCDAPPNAAVLWEAPSTRFVILGEVHGTTEAPSAFGEMVCEASSGRPVVVGLEFEDMAQPAIDAWMASTGDADDRAAFLASSAFTRKFEDGRSSVAMLALFERLRLLKTEGRDVSVAAFRPTMPPPPGFDQNYGELAMAQHLSVMAQARPDALAMILVGRFHASLAPIGDFRPAASHLPPAEVVSVILTPQGGTLWSCGGDDPLPVCGINQAGGEDDGSRGIVLRPGPDSRFNGALALGPLTASAPARQGSE